MKQHLNRRQFFATRAVASAALWLALVVSLHAAAAARSAARPNMLIILTADKPEMVTALKQELARIKTDARTRPCPSIMKLITL
jgi:hypothetical protein